MTRYPIWMIFFVFCFSLTACQAVLHEKGSILDPKKVAQIKVGETTQAEVKDILGVPTIVNSFQKNRWSYIQDRQFKNLQRTFSRAVNRVEITFDQRGVVQNVSHNFDKELMDPEALPAAKNDKPWLQWLWGGDYIRPATEVEEQQPKPKNATVANTPKPTPSDPQNPSQPWWKFWSHR